MEMSYITYESVNDCIKKLFGNSVYIEKESRVHGGDINDAFRLTLSNGESVFLKQNSKENYSFFISEYEGLKALCSTEKINCPEVYGIGADDRTGTSFLVMEYIEPARMSISSQTDLGYQLARLHMSDASAFTEGGMPFGFFRNNYIGASVQINTLKKSWIDFFRDCRLEPQIKMAEAFLDSEQLKKCGVLLGHLDKYLEEPAKASLLHGDLWGGNVMSDTEKRVWFIDPAVYAGHHEADLAMTQLFGGFTPAFYSAYNEIIPVDPGYKDRRDLYNLYHLLNHLNLFGRGYLGEVLSVINHYV